MKSNTIRKKLDFLDRTLYIVDDRLEVDVFSKATDAHLYLLPSSNHPPYTTLNIPYGVGLRLRRICSDNTRFEGRLQEYGTYFLNRGYQEEHIRKEFAKVRGIQSKKVLSTSIRSHKDRIAFIMKWDPRLPNLNAVIRKNLKLLYSDPENKKIFPQKSFMVSYKRSRNLKEILVPTKLPKTDYTPTQNGKHPGCFKCSAKNCDICQNCLKETKKFSSLVTKNSYHIKHHLSCNQKSCIYLITCNKCKLQYIGSTVNFKARWRLHKFHVKQKKIASCRVASHWCGNHQIISDLEIIIIEQELGETSDINSLLLTREIFWQHTLLKFEPYGMNKRDDLYSNRTTF